MLRVKKLSKCAIIPTKAHPGDAGWDLYANNDDDVHIEFGRRALISTGISLAIPEGYYGRVADRSGNAWKCGMHTFGGVIDSKYRGEVKVILANLGCDEGFIVKKGDRIAQLVITKIHVEDMIEVDDLDETERGENGFGSSGTNKDDDKKKIDMEWKEMQKQSIDKIKIQLNEV